MSEHKVNDKMTRFYDETGIWPPGRSMPAAMCGGEDERMIAARAWDLWIKSEKVTAQRDAYLEALKGVCIASDGAETCNDIEVLRTYLLGTRDMANKAIAEGEK